MTVFKSNLRRILKSKANLIFMVIFPVVFIAIAMASSFGASKITIGITDYDNTKFTKMFIENLKHDSNIKMIDESDIKSKLIDDGIQYAMVIDKGFTDKIINGTDPRIKGYSVQESNIALPSKYYIESFINTAKNIGAASQGNEDKFYRGIEDYKKGSFGVEYKDVKNTGRKGDKTVAALGFLIMSMLFLSGNAGQLILDDKQNKTFYRIFASPISTKSYMIQNVLSNLSILIIQLIVIFAIMLGVFHAYFGPSILNVFVLFVIFSLLCVSLAIAVVSVSKTPRQAGSITTFITVPMCMLGGCFWPRSLMPDILTKISNFIPTTWVLRASEKVINGSSLFSVRIEIAILMLFIVVFMLLGSWKKADITK